MRIWSEKYPNSIRLIDDMIENCEVILGVKLPVEFINILKTQNGGYIDDFVIDKEDVVITELFGFYFNDENPTILDSEYLSKEWNLPKGQIIISGDGHTWITLDYSSSTDPKVRCLDLERNKNKVISESFSDFLSQLKRMV